MLSKSNVTEKRFWCGEEITEEQYNSILSMIQNKPVAPEGWDYRLTKELKWELCELMPVEMVDEVATEEDYINALAQLGVDAYA